MASPDLMRFTLMALPQSFDGNKTITLNIVFLPRNINPLNQVSVSFPTAAARTAFADIRPQFDVMVVKNPSEFPGKIPANEIAVAPNALNYSPDVRRIYETLKNAVGGDGKPKYFDIDEARSSDKVGSDEHRTPKAVDKENALKKYLPVSYREAFNFTTPRIPNAKTDDSYFCAMRDKAAPQVIVKDDKVSWGKVYAYLMRQPLMAEKAGLIYKTSVTINVDDYKNGGWLYVRMKGGTPYSQEQQDAATAGGFFIKQYAAHIPILKAGEATPLFAAVLFPVMKVGEDAVGNFDDVFIEASRYRDGFAKIAHANQPVSHNFLKEEQDGLHPQKEIGIRLGWEDEQILIWYLRQMSKDETTGERLDAPLGVTGYHIDVQDAAAPAGWESLTGVQSNGELFLEDINIGNFTGELPYGVYPTKLYGVNSQDYWLPMYFTNWNDYSLVLPDKTPAMLYKNSEDVNNPVAVTDTYSPIANTIRLQYGKQYNFRVRLADMTGGGPTPDAPSPASLEPSGVAKAPFKRFVAPHALRLSGDTEIIRTTDDANFNGDQLTIQRPLLGYPSVVFTGRYADPIALLQADVAQSIVEKRAFGIADPDVVKVEIKVEVETLQMDNLLSESGKEHFITLFKTYRNFDAANFDAPISVDIIYKDIPVLQLDRNLFADPYPVAADNDFIAATEGAIILPTARNLRITLRAVCEGGIDYWGNNSLLPDLNSRFGKTTALKMRRASQNEAALFANLADPQLLQGIYLQPDPVPEHKNKIEVIRIGDGIPDIVQRLAKQLDLECNGLTLMAKKGQRIQFGCSNFIRHTLAPDNSSITFANKNELLHHWLVNVSLVLDRDWTWDGLEDRSFVIERQHQFFFENKNFDDVNPAKEITVETVGDIEMHRIAPYQAIQEGDDGQIHREKTLLIFIDAIDPKPFGSHLPDTLAARYTIRPQYRKNEADETPAHDEDFTTQILNLPTTINPHSIPRLIGAGIALSPYMRNKKYSATEVRKRYLWLEFDQGPDEERDALFCRVLAYAPDQLLSNNNPSLYGIETEPPLPIDPEYIRVIATDSPHNHPGLNAMQRMEKSTEKDRHFYLLPLPPGLHNESAELFGFYTYEFRFGHTDQLWSTAQGRFGRALRVTGIQHPAPSLTCTVNRDDKVLNVSAPYATTVFKGRNVTSNPPRTSIWALLYAQVKQADGLDYRNILLDEKRLLQPSPSVIREKITAEFHQKNLPLAELDTALQLHLALQVEAPRYAQGVWTNEEIVQILRLYGLPPDAPLSILCVEVFGQITNIKEHINNFDRTQENIAQGLLLEFGKDTEKDVRNMIKLGSGATIKDNADRPLSDDLGKYRILRTSPLVEVPFVCCTDC